MKRSSTFISRDSLDNFLRDTKRYQRDTVDDYLRDRIVSSNEDTPVRPSTRRAHFHPKFNPFLASDPVFRSWVINKYSDLFAWYDVPQFQWKWFYDPARSYKVRFSLFSFLLQNGISPLLAYEICRDTDKENRHEDHYRNLMAKAVANLDYWNDIPYYDVILKRVVTPRLGDKYPRVVTHSRADSTAFNASQFV